MVWEIFKREDYYQGSDKPFITISSDHVTFNTMFTKIARLVAGKYVKIHVDSDNLKLGFEFLDKNEPNTFKLTSAPSATIGEKRNAVFCASVGVIKKYTWLTAVAKLSGTQDKRFEPMKEGGLWVIQVCPAFETKRARESADIPSDLQGIYRYLRENGEIVYIGRGNIKARLVSPERKDWDFDVIEYSKVDNPDQQVKWESYWIERYKDENNGKLPFYNKVSGIDKE